LKLCPKCGGLSSFNSYFCKMMCNTCEHQWEEDGTKLIRLDGKEYGLNEIQRCPHCDGLICPEIIIKHFTLKYCHYCGEKVEY